MANMILFVVVSVIWLSTLVLFKREKMNFFKFLVGSVGIFTISMMFFMPFLERYLNLMIVDGLIFIGGGRDYYQVFKDNSIISVATNSGIVSILINYECSGVIEMLVFTSLALFFPFGKGLRRALVVVIGNIYIYLVNIIRILFIVFMTRGLGTQAYYLTHTLFARILFFGFMVVLYYFVFTSTHLKYQTVGEIR